MPYWYHAPSGQSTYQRPLPASPIPFPPPNFSVPPPGYPAFPPSSSSSAPAAEVKEKRKKKEKAKHKTAIEGTSWVRVRTSEGNTFYMNKASKESVWAVPDEIKVRRPANSGCAESAAYLKPDVPQSEVAALEAQEQAAEDARVAEESASAKAELERLRAEIAEAKAAQAAASAAASKKRKQAPVPTAPAAMKAAQRPKIESRPPQAAAAPPPKKEEPEADGDLDIDALSALHNPPSPSHGEPMAAGTHEENDGEEADGNIGPAGPEEEEAWQRQIAAEMGIEYVSPEDREAQEKRDKAEEKRKEAEEKARVREEAGRSVFGQAPVGGRVEITLDEGKALFKVRPCPCPLSKRPVYIDR